MILKNRASGPSIAVACLNFLLTFQNSFFLLKRVVSRTLLFFSLLFVKTANVCAPWYSTDSTQSIWFNYLWRSWRSSGVETNSGLLPLPAILVLSGDHCTCREFINLPANIVLTYWELLCKLSYKNCRLSFRLSQVLVK